MPENIKNLLKFMNSGFAYHKIITNNKGEAVDYIYLDVNPAFETITGLKNKEIINKKASEIYPKTENFNLDIYAKVALNKESVEFIHYSKSANKYFNIKSYCSKTGYFAIIIDDITDKENIKKALEESFQKYKILADYTFHWEYWKGPEKNFLYISPSCKRISGFSDRDFYADPELFFKQIDSQDKGKWRNHEKLTNKQICCETPLTLRFKTKAGANIWLEHICQPVFSDTNDFLGYRGTNRDVTEQKEMQQKILNAIIETEENERKRIAQELHDGIGPILTTSKLYAEAYLRSNNETYKKQAKQHVIQSMEEAIRQVSIISNNLSPHILSDFGLEAAINKLFDRLTPITQINYNFKYKITSTLLPNVEITFYRVITELLNNSLKYANAQNISITLTEKSKMLVLEYSDDGIGFDFEEVKTTKKQMGLFNITNRVYSLNGTVTFTNKLKGIKYNISVPTENNVII